MAAEPSVASGTEDNEQEPPRASASGDYLFVVLHCDRPLAGGIRCSLSHTDLVTFGRGVARTVSRRRDGELRTLDLRLPGNTISSTHARLIRDGERWLIEDAQSRNGTLLNGERVTRAVLRDGDLLEVGAVILRYRAGLPTSPDVTADLDTAALAPAVPGWATLLPDLGNALAALGRIAASPVTVLLLGESGSGKELLARAVHTLSNRRGPFVAVNCGGLSASLLESQLFGHTKGSFTGAARDEPGMIRSADRGTIFLDEIGDLPLPAQAALLRVLQEREVVPVGGTQPIKVDLRVVAATHRPLEQMAAQGTFRADLLARLSGYRHRLAPLSRRLEDFGLLTGELLRRVEVPSASAIRISPAAGRYLLKRPWPLNIRELQQCLAMAATLAENGVIEIAHLPLLEPAREEVAHALASVSETSHRPGPPRKVALSRYSKPGDKEALRLHLVALLEEHEGKVSYVARDLGKARTQIHRWMQRFGIDPSTFRK
jgi:transcriptional regulator with AAA-type ATPase domain